MACAALCACGGSAQGPGADEPEPSEARPTSHRASTPPTDDGPDDGVEVTGTMGRLDAYDVQHGIEPYAAALSACYRDNLRRRRYIGGQIEMLLVVNTDGAVKSASIVKSDLGSLSIESCLVHVGQTIHFSRPEGGVAEVRLPLSFEGVGRLSFWDQERVDAELAVAGEHETDIRKTLSECTEETGTRPPRHGVVVTAYVANRGHIKAAGFEPIAEQTLDPVWAGCAHAAILSWRLSDPRGRVAKISFTLAGS